MLKIDMSEFNDLKTRLELLNHRGIPFANRAALNSAAFDARRESLKTIDKKMVLRNKWTLKNIAVNKAVGIDMNRQFSEVGSKLAYMETQEFGGIKRKEGKHGVPLTTTEATGEGRNVQPRRKIARSNLRLGRFELAGASPRPKGQPKNRRQEWVFKVQDAIQSGQRIFFMKSSGAKTTGIYRVRGGGRKGRKIKRGIPSGVKVDLLYSLKEPALRIPRNPWLKPSVDETKKRMPALYVEAFRFQIDRILKRR